VFVCRYVVVSTGVGRGGKVGMLLRWWGLGGEVEELGGRGGRDMGGMLGGGGVWNGLGCVGGWACAFQLGYNMVVSCGG